MIYYNNYDTLFLSTVDDVDTDLLRLLAAKAMNNKGNKKDSLNRGSDNRYVTE